MEIAKLQGETRKAGGSREASRLRRQNKLPGVVYGHGLAPESVAVPRREFEIIMEHGAHVLELEVGGSRSAVLVKAMQFDCVGTTPTHVDFMRVDLNERVKVSVPLEYRGTPAGTLEGGVFQENMVDVEVEAVVTQIPESIRVNVADLKLGGYLHVKDLQLPEGVKAITPPDAILCAVRAKVAEEVVVAPVEGEEPKEPEIITAKAKPTEEEAAEKK
ncbi:MAG: 50S ribosomal protein L25 [Phycisphaerae bacterium]|nr:50S ribosomal protein L25 [Phycisphaerae bacterium]